MNQWSGGVLLFMLTGLLGGCADAQLAELAKELGQKRKAAGTQLSVAVSPVPEYQRPAYIHGGERSPFLDPETVAGQSASVQRANANRAPETSREPQSLELFALEELTVVGILQMNNHQRALIRTPEGEVASVSEGHYIGSDYGRVKRIGARHIEIDERVLTSSGDWQVREATLLLDGE